MLRNRWWHAKEGIMTCWYQRLHFTEQMRTCVRGCGQNFFVTHSFRALEWAFPWSQTQKCRRQNMPSSKVSDWKHRSKTRNMDSKNSIYVVCMEKVSWSVSKIYAPIHDAKEPILTWRNRWRHGKEPLMTRKGTEHDMLEPVLSC